MKRFFVSLILLLWSLPAAATDFTSQDELYGWNGVDQFYQTWADHLTQLDITFEAELDDSAGLRAALSDETGSGLAVFNTSPSITTPSLLGVITYVGTAVDIDDCTGRQGQGWWDSVDSAFEFCSANSGVPIQLSGSGTYQLDLAVPSDTEVATGTATTERVWTAAKIKYAIDTLGSTSRWDVIADPTAASEIDFGSYVTELNVTDFRVGDGGSNYIRFLDDGGTIKMSFEGNAVMVGSLGSGVVAYSNLAADAKFQSLAVADLGDTSTPSVLTTEETTNKLISNYKATGADHVFALPAAHAGGNVIFMIGDEFQVDLEPPSGTAFYLNGTAMASDEHIQNTADTLAEQIACVTANLNGTLRWMCESKYSNWAEATP